MYVLEETASKVRLQNLLLYGFPSSLQFKYYSFLQFKEECKKTGKSVDEVSNDLETFLNCLKQVHSYFVKQPDYVENQELAEFAGPQSR